MGKPCQLIQVVGYAFELGYEIQMLATQAFSYRSCPKQLSDDFRRTLPRSTGQ